MLARNGSSVLLSKSPSGLRPVPLTRVSGTHNPRLESHQCAAQNQESFVDSIKRVAKKVQGALPVIGLISRLTSSEGGFDELAYPEYCRYVINTAPESMKFAMTDLEKKYGKIASSRWLLLLLWMTKTGSGLVPAKDIISAARRMRITQDIEIEIDRFDITRSNTLKKYDMMAPPEGKLQDKVSLAVDAICMLCIGLKEADSVSDDDAALLTTILKGAFPEVDANLITASITAKSQRAGSYAAA